MVISIVVVRYLFSWIPFYLYPLNYCLNFVQIVLSWRKKYFMLYYFRSVRNRKWFLIQRCFQSDGGVFYFAYHLFMSCNLHTFINLFFLTCLFLLVKAGTDWPSKDLVLWRGYSEKEVTSSFYIACWKRVNG